MFDLYNSSGYDLYQPFPELDQWVIDPKSTQPYRGNLKEIVKYMIYKLDFRMDDIEAALNLLADNIENDHNAIHFGIFKYPMYSFKKEEKYGRKAS